MCQLILDVLHDKVVRPTLIFNVKRMRNKYIIISLLSFLIIDTTLITLPTWGQENDFTKKDLTRMNIPTMEEKRIVIGADVNYPPYSFMDKQGRPQGHNIEVMNKLATILKIQVEYKLEPWSEALQDLKDGVVDALIGIIYLDARKQFYDFTIPVWFESYTIFASRDARFEDLDDLYRGRIVALKGDASISRFINPMGLTERTMFVNTLPDAIWSVEKGESDFVLAPHSLGMDVIDNSDYRNIRIVGSPVLPSFYCIAVQKGNSELLEVLNKGIDTLKSEGTIQRINEKWFIQRKKEISLTGVFKILYTVLVPIAVIILALFFWSWLLRRQVRIKTIELEEANNKLELLATTDPLTKLKNRKSMLDSLEYEKRLYKRNEESFSIIMIDIDYFKAFNDQYGHNCGDFVLIKFAEKISSIIREQDTVARWGGEEFLILLPQTNINEAKIVAEKLRIIISKTFVKFENLKLSITITLGVSEFNKLMDIDCVIKKADEGLYRGKKGGRNCVATS